MADMLLGIYGASGHGRETMALARAKLAAPDVVLVFIDDAPQAETVNGQRVLTFDQFAGAAATRKRVNIAIGDSRIRERLADRCAAARLEFISVHAPNAVVGDDVSIGEGAILSAFALLTANVRLGRHVHVNMHASVAHDCVLGDYVTLATGVRCNGNVTIEDHAYIGSGAILRNGAPGAPLVIGEGAIVGMGAIVTRNVPAGTTVAGNPARPLEPSR